MPTGGLYLFRRDGEKHRWSPQVVHALQKAARSGDFADYAVYRDLANEDLTVLRALLRLKTEDLTPVPLRGDVRPTPIGPPLAPDFTGKLEFTPVVGWPFSGAGDLVATGWISLGEDAVDELSPAIIAAMADGWWIAALAGVDVPTADSALVLMSTLDFMLQFPAAPPPTPPSELWRTGLWHEGRIVAGRDGYLIEERVLRAPTGEVLAWNTQLVAVGRTA